MRLGLCLSLLLLLAGGAAPLTAATPHLVKDIDPVPQAESSSPHDFENVLPGLSLFTANDGQTGNELWRTDGTPGGTFRLTDVCPGECSSQPSFVGHSDRLNFFLVRGASSSELWVTDGTPGGTLFLTSAALPGLGVWVASQRLLYFPAYDVVHGAELWRSDGTPAGTFLVTDLRPGPASSNLSELVDFNGKLYFQANDRRGTSLWTSDGTPQGIRLVRNLTPYSNFVSRPLLAVLGRTLYFTAMTPKHGVQLWRSDGTANGTFSITTLQLAPTQNRPAPGTSPFFDFAILKNRLLFTAITKGSGGQLWTTDGSAKGTQPLTHFHPQEIQGVGISAVFNNRLVFEANDGVHGYEYWTTDGTPRGTSLVEDICPGPCSGATFTVSSSGNLLYFAATDGVHGREPWVSNGTATGTHMIADLCPGSCDSAPFGIRPAGGQVYLVAQDGTHGLQVWRSDGTAAGTYPLTAWPFALESNIQGAVLGGTLVFAAPETLFGTELWRSDGTPQGTGLLANINNEDTGGSFPTNLTAVSDQAYFFAVSSGETSLWRSDGTAVGTVEAARLMPDRFNSFTELVGVAGKEFFLMTAEGETSPSLWRTDGTVNGTFRLDPEGLVGANRLTAVGNLVFFVGRDADHGNELWVTDGSVEGTRLVADLEPGSLGSLSFQPRTFKPFQGHLYFTALTSDSGRLQLWRSDGTEGGTARVQDVAPPISAANPASLTVHNGRLWFFAQDDEGNSKLWSTDGTSAGTRIEPLLIGPGFIVGGTMFWDGNRVFFSGAATDLGSGLFVWDGTPGGLRHVSNVAINEDFFNPAGGVISNGILYFSGRDSSFQNNLWVSDGTEAGTRQVLDTSGNPISEPHYFQTLSGGVYFTNRDKLFQTDGTATGTVILTRLAAPGEFVFHELVASGPRLFFRKWDPATGAELWALEAN